MNFPYIEGCVNTDVLVFTVQNGAKNKHLYIYMTTEEVEMLQNEIQEAIEQNKRVMGIRTQEFTFRWF